VNEGAWFDEHALPRLERMVGSKVLGEVLDLYFENAPQRLAAIREGAGANDLAAAALALHDLKSSAGMVGALAVQRLAEKMEGLARRRDGAALREHLESLAAAVARADERLRAARERRGAC
jgi:HPt (histidine-containing phosphotransfer) domain-containing protein